MLRVLLVAAALAAPAAALAQTFSCKDPETKRLRIINPDRDARPKDWPFIVGFFHRNAPGKPFCGGSLVNAQWVLTAAHCIQPRPNVTLSASDLTVRRVAADGTPGGEAVALAAEPFVHPEYRPVGEPKHDIALVKLAQPVAIFNSELPRLADTTMSDNLASEGSCSAVAGWGLTGLSPTPDTPDPRRSFSRVLLEVGVRVVGGDACKAAWDANRKGREGISTATQLCAGGARDSCQGDSGGPLIVKGGPTGYLLVGVVSFGDETCGVATMPGVYTRVAHYRSWIFDTIGDNS